MLLNSVWARAAGVERTIVELAYVHPIEPIEPIGPVAVVSVRADRLGAAAGVRGVRSAGAVVRPGSAAPVALGRSRAAYGLP